MGELSTVPDPQNTVGTDERREFSIFATEASEDQPEHSQRSYSPVPPEYSPTPAPDEVEHYMGDAESDAASVHLGKRELKRLDGLITYNCCCMLL